MEQNNKELSVVSFHNSTGFDFTPEMGCMFDGRPIHGSSGFGIKSGEEMKLPFHVGERLSENLAKAYMLRHAPEDAPGVPTGQVIWDETTLKNKANSFIAELYREERAAPKSEADVLLAKVEEYKKMVDNLISKSDEPSTGPSEDVPAEGEYLDKQAVIAKLEEKGIKHDKRKPRDFLLKLLENGGEESSLEE